MKVSQSAKKPLSYYVYETRKVSIFWRGIKQPLGMFFSASDAYEEIKKQCLFSGGMEHYSIHTPNDAIYLTKEGY